MHSSFRWLALGAATSLVAYASPALAQTGTFNVPSQDLSTAVRQFARQAKIQVVLPGRLAKGRKSKAVVGSLPIDQALSRMLAGTGLVARSTAADTYVVMAGTAAPAQAPSGGAKKEEVAADGGEIIVTGSARAERRFDVSYAANAMSQKEITQAAPTSLAELLGRMPGIQVELTGGEVQNITRIRGIPTDDGYAVIQQDGLTMFHDILAFSFRGDSLNRLDLMTDRVEVVRGGPAPIFASQAAGIVNNITVTGTDTTRGAARVTTGSFHLARLDLMQAGPLGKDTYYAVGGFIRRGGAIRPTGFPGDKGGQVRANIKHDLENGSIRVSANYLNDHNIFYMPIPLQDPRDHSVSLDPYIDYFKGNVSSNALRNVNIKYLDSAGVLQNEQRDIANNRHMRFGNVGLQYEGEFGEWTVSAKGNYSKGKMKFDAMFSTTAAVDGDDFLASNMATVFTPAFREAFPTATGLAYAIGGTNGAQLYDPNAESGLVLPYQYRAIDVDFYSGQADLSVTRKFQTGWGTHDVKAGIYGSSYGTKIFQAFQDYIMQLRNKPETLDIIAVDAAGKPVMSGGRTVGLTDNGVYRYATTLTDGDVDSTVWAVYANDTWQMLDDLRVDFGMRHEEYNETGYSLETAAVDLGDPNTVADNITRRFTGAMQRHTLKPKATNWTLGVNYDISRQFGGYARVSHLEVPNLANAAALINPVIVNSKADQYEVGLKASIGRSYLYVTGFYTKFDPYNASFLTLNPATGQGDLTVPFFGEVTIKGVEADGAFTPVPWFTLAGSLTVQNPSYSNVTLQVDAPIDINGNQIIRQPKYFGNIRPTFNFDAGGTNFEIYGRYEFSGKVPVDITNNTYTPSYNAFNLGITASRGTWQIQAVGSNITNAKGLTEGNPRADTIGGQGTREATYGRVMPGRNLRLIVTKSW